MTLSSEEITEIYKVAHSLLPTARVIARRQRIAPHVGEDLMMEAAVRVIEFRQNQDAESKIENLAAYILRTFKNLIYSARKTVHAQNLTEKEWASLSLPEEVDISQRLTDVILIEEIIKRMDEPLRFIFERRLMGLSFEEIVAEYQKAFDKPIQASPIRNIYYRGLSKLVKQLSDK